MITEPAKTFSRVFRGYDPAAVDASIETLTAKQQLLLNDVKSLEARLTQSGDEAAALRKEVAVLTDTSPSPHAVQLRMAKMLRRAVDEVSEMQAEARAEADALIAAAEAEVEASRRKHEERMADLAAQREALEGEYDEKKKKLDAELAGMRADTERAIEEASPTPSRRPITIVSRPGGPRTMRASSESRSWSNWWASTATWNRFRPLSRRRTNNRRICRRQASWCRWARRSARGEPAVALPRRAANTRYSRRRVDREPHADRRAGPADSRCGTRF